MKSEKSKKINLEIEEEHYHDIIENIEKISEDLRKEHDKKMQEIRDRHQKEIRNIHIMGWTLMAAIVIHETSDLWIPVVKKWLN